MGNGRMEGRRKVVTVSSGDGKEPRSLGKVERPARGKAWGCKMKEGHGDPIGEARQEAGGIWRQHTDGARSCIFVCECVCACVHLWCVLFGSMTRSGPFCRGDEPIPRT